MFITSFIKHKLASALQPWLLQEPELELNLGFLRSHVIAKNLRFNVVALNETLEDSSSFCFTDFRIDQLKLRIVNWSASAFNWEVKGLYVTVSPRVVEGRDLELSEALMEEKKKVLREIDPEGSALHDIMGKLADISLSGSQTSSLSKLILNYCSLQLSDIKLQIHPSISDDSFECLWEIAELNVDPRQVNPQSFPRGYINSLFVYSNDSSFDLEIRGLNTTLKTHDRITQLCFATDIITSLKMNDFQLTELHCSIEELGFSFSPADISTIVVSIQELSRKSPPVRNRNGKQLWKETATKIRSLISTQRWSMWKLVTVVCLWLRYVHAWENLFSLVGYPINIMIKRSTLNMATNSSFSESFTRQWEVITEIEKELPAPGIALARRVVQCRNAKNVVPSENELPDRKQLRYFQNAWRLFCLIWTTICCVFNSILHWILLRNSFASDCNTERTGVLPEDSCANLCYRLNFGKILITVSPDNTASDRKVSHLDLLSFCLVFDAFIIIYNNNICENHLIFSCGSFKAISSSAIKGRKKPEILNSKTILWSNPVRVFNQKGTEMVSLPLLGSLIKQMWSDWKISRAEFEIATDKNMENPFILCAIKRLLEDQGPIFKCCLAVGQLDLFLEYSATLSLTLLFQQMQNVFSQREKGLKGHTSSLTSCGVPPIRVWDYHSCIAEMEKLVTKVLPERLIQVGVYISGPQIRVSLSKDRSHGGITNLHEAVDDLNLLFDCKNIELMMSPNLGSDFTFLNDETTERVHTNEIYKCRGQRVLDASLKVHGINAYLDDLPELQQSQIISLKPITIQLSTVRKDTWSLGESISMFSALLHGNALGLSGLIYVDELFVLVEAVNGLMLSLSRAFKTVDSSSSITSHLSNIQETSHIRSENEMLVSTSTGKSLVVQSKLYILKISSEIQPMDLVIQKSRKVNAMENEVTISESFTNQNLSVHFLPDNGIQISCQKIHMNLSYEKKKGKMEGLAEFSGLQAVVFRYANDVMHRSHNICELSVSHCTFDLSLTHLPNELSSGSNVSHTMEDPVSKSTVLDARISSSEFYLIGCSLKDVIVGKHQSSKLEMSLSVVQGCQTTVSCHCQGGIIFLETTSTLMLSQFGNAYIRRIRHLLRGRPSLKENPSAENIVNITTWGIPDDFTMDLSQFYLALFANDESGRLQELLFGADMNLNLKVINTRKKMSFGVSQLSILSRVLKQSNKHQSGEVQIPHTSSSTSSDPSLYLVRQDEIQSVTTDARTSSSDSHQGSENYILKKLSCFLSAEEPVPRDTSDTLKSNEPWVGSGSISGFDVTVSLPEIQMMLSVVELSEFSSKETIANVQQRQLYNDEEPARSFEEIVQDGSIVAIQDVDQHMYVVVEGGERKYHLAGAMHYSLAGEMALFRVKYHYQRIWKSSYLWFSLTSLCAKNESGEYLQLNCNTKSNFVELSCSGNSGPALWRSQPFKSSSFEDDGNLESYNNAENNLFYLINKKNNCSVSFVEGVLEFVSSPGNPFKWKVFQDFSLVRDPPLLNNSSVDESTSPFINVVVDKFSLTIYHELSDTTEKFPLLQMSMVAPELIVQILNSKARVMARLIAELYAFDAQRNLWSTFLHPVEVSIFWRSRFQSDASGTVLHRMPVHFYTRVKEFRVSMIELSLDILLFVIGKLNLAGPYAIQSSVILANCCKVENQSDLMLLCQFSDKQYATIARKQSTTMFLRNLALDQPPEASIVSIQLAASGDFYTSPIKFSLLKAGTFAWRTRILSKKDSETFPGPLIIVEITWKSEDGLSIIVSPLLRIHNRTDFPIELRFQRPEQENEHASVVLKAGGTIDDSIAAFDVIKASGGSKKALISLSVGDIIFSFRPKISDDSMGWSDELKGGKAAHLSGLFDKISYHVRKAFPVESEKSSFSTARTLLKSKEGEIDDLHFLIHSTKKDVPILQSEQRASTISLLEQKEIHILPTVQISNLLESEIQVVLSDKDRSLPKNRENMSKHATIPCGSSVNMYANPEAMFFTVTLTAFGLSCKPVNCGDWAKNLLKQKKDNRNLDMELNFGDGRYFGSLRLSCGHRGILEAAIFTPYTLKNNTDFDLFCLAPYHNPLSRNEAEELRSQGYSQLGALLPPKSTISWFLRTNKVSLRLLDDKATEKALLDLDAVSGLTEINLEMEEKLGLKYITKLGVSLDPSIGKVVPSQVVSLSPRYVVLNESDEVITIRQCNLEDDMEGMTTVSSKQRKALRLCNKTNKKRETSIFENFIRKHRNIQDDSLLYIQFRPNEAGLGWSGPVCVASMGRFFIKFRRSINVSETEENTHDFAVVIVSEENSSLVLRFHRPPNMNFPYRIENCLRDASITYYQKGSTELETLGCEKQVNYVWDDLSLTHKLVIQISGLHLLREVNLDKVRPWKPFYKVGKHRVLGFNFPQDKKAEQKVKPTGFSRPNETQMVNLGYEVYADGLTRVVRICERSDSRKLDKVFNPGAKITVRVSRFSISLCERAKQEEVSERALVYTSIVVMRLSNISLDSMLTDQQKVNQIRVQSMSVDQKWVGAPFAAMLRRHQSGFSDTCDSMLRIVLILLPSSSNIRQVKYSSIVLQPVDLNLDEETLMKIVPFYRKSLSDPNTPSRQYYFDHFEIHPVKIIANFLPGDSYSSYNSTQETLRTLLHSVIKVPEIKSKNVELNGVLVTHALITLSELSIKCAQHYSWYVMRAIYIAKGSPLLPPAFASIFDDLASSSLDVFFDPSSALVKLPGLTIGTFKLLSKCIDGKGFSGTKRYLGDLGKTLKNAGSNILFAAVTEVSDAVLKGAETNGFNGMFNGFQQGILKLAMEPSVLGSAFTEGGPDRKIKLDRNPGVDELYIEGYLQAMLDTMYKHEYLRVRVIDDQVVLKNMPPNSVLIDEIMDHVKGFLVSKGLLTGETSSYSLRHLRVQNEWRIVPTVLTLCEHLFVNFAIGWLRKQAGDLSSKIKWDDKFKVGAKKAITKQETRVSVWKWGVGQFVFAGIVAYVDGRLCRSIPNPVARRIVSGFVLSFLDRNDDN
ncbi:putative vacuolar protein sorting-associated protein [Helianthus annuus]|nr:putative vacuolar protein sorting-associated protein [Helianthus annuus]